MNDVSLSSKALNSSSKDDCYDKLDEEYEDRINQLINSPSISNSNSTKSLHPQTTPNKLLSGSPNSSSQISQLFNTNSSSNLSNSKLNRLKSLSNAMIYINKSKELLARKSSDNLANLASHSVSNQDIKNSSIKLNENQELTPIISSDSNIRIDSDIENNNSDDIFLENALNDLLLINNEIQMLQEEKEKEQVEEVEQVEKQITFESLSNNSSSLESINNNKDNDMEKFIDIKIEVTQEDKIKDEEIGNEITEEIEDDELFEYVQTLENLVDKLEEDIFIVKKENEQFIKILESLKFKYNELNNINKKNLDEIISKENEIVILKDEIKIKEHDLDEAKRAHEEIMERICRGYEQEIFKDEDILHQMNKINQKLILDHQNIDEKNLILVLNYNQLEQNYKKQIEKNNELQLQYDELMINFNDLQASFDELNLKYKDSCNEIIHRDDIIRELRVKNDSLELELGEKNLLLSKLNEENIKKNQSLIKKWMEIEKKMYARLHYHPIDSKDSIENNESLSPSLELLKKTQKKISSISSINAAISSLTLVNIPQNLLLIESDEMLLKDCQSKNIIYSLLYLINKKNDEIVTLKLNNSHYEQELNEIKENYYNNYLTYFQNNSNLIEMDREFGNKYNEEKNLYKEEFYIKLNQLKIEKKFLFSLINIFTNHEENLKSKIKNLTQYCHQNLMNFFTYHNKIADEILHNFQFNLLPLFHDFNQLLDTEMYSFTLENNFNVKSTIDQKKNSCSKINDELNSPNKTKSISQSPTHPNSFETNNNISSNLSPQSNSELDSLEEEPVQSISYPKGDKIFISKDNTLEENILQSKPTSPRTALNSFNINSRRVLVKLMNECILQEKFLKDSINDALKMKNKFYSDLDSCLMNGNFNLIEDSSLAISSSSSIFMDLTEVVNNLKIDYDNSLNKYESKEKKLLSDIKELKSNINDLQLNKNILQKNILKKKDQSNHDMSYTHLLDELEQIKHNITTQEDIEKKFEKLLNNMNEANQINSQTNSLLPPISPSNTNDTLTQALFQIDDSKIKLKIKSQVRLAEEIENEIIQKKRNLISNHTIENKMIELENINFSLKEELNNTKEEMQKLITNYLSQISNLKKKLKQNNIQ